MNEKIWHPSALFVCLLILGLLPFITLSRYVMPNLEDYAESIIPDVWWHVKFLYLTFDGRYFTSLLFAAANPLKYGSYAGYQLIPVVLICLLFAAIFALIRSFVTNLGKSSVFGLSVVAMLTFIDLNPNIPYSFYYMISSYIYMLPCIMFMLFLAVCKVLLTSSSSYVTVIHTVAAILLIVAISGSNELLLPPTLVVIGLLFFLNRSYQLGKGGQIAAITISFLCALFVVFTSPGVHDSMAFESGDITSLHYNWNVIAISLRISGYHILNWLTMNPILYVGTLTYVLVILYDGRMYGESWLRSVGYKHLFLFAVMGVFGIMLVAVPYCWAHGNKSTHTYSQIFVVSEMFFLLLWFIVTHLLTLKLYGHLRMAAPQAMKALMVAIVLMASLILVNPSGNVHAAYSDLFSGEAAGYFAEVSYHVHQSRNSAKFADSTGTLQLCELKHRPTTIFSGIYFNHNDDGFHLQYRRYFSIERLEIIACE